jgi:hypothetical protein
MALEMTLARAIEEIIVRLRSIWRCRVRTRKISTVPLWPGSQRRGVFKALAHQYGDDSTRRNTPIASTARFARRRVPYPNERVPSASYDPDHRGPGQRLIVNRAHHRNRPWNNGRGPLLRCNSVRRGVRQRHVCRAAGGSRSFSIEPRCLVAAITSLVRSQTEERNTPGFFPALLWKGALCLVRTELSNLRVETIGSGRISTARDPTRRIVRSVTSGKMIPMNYYGASPELFCPLSVRFSSDTKQPPRHPLEKTHRSALAKAPDEIS